MAKWIVEIVDGWKPGNCAMECDYKGPDKCLNCPLANAKEAVEVKGSIARAMETQFDKPVVLYAVKAEGEK